MEAVELYREESEKLEEHSAACKAAGKEVWWFLDTQSPLREKHSIWLKFSFSLHKIGLELEKFTNTDF